MYKHDKKQNAKREGRRAFTLLELLLVIAIISVLAGIIMFSLKPADRLREANQTKYLSNANDIEKAFNSYIVDNGGSLPASFSSLTFGYYDICRQGQSGSCVSLDELVTNGKISSIPVDADKLTVTLTGFKVRYDPNKKEAIVYSSSEFTGRVDSGVTFTEGLVGYWKMDEVSWNGTAGEVIDSSNRGNNGTSLNGATTALGKFGNGGNFNAAGYVTVADNVLFETAGTKSVSVWIRPTAANSMTIFQKYMSDTPTQDGWTVTYNTSVLRVWIKNENGSVFEPPTFTATLNQWYHVVFTWDTNGGFVKFYVNGVLVGSSPQITGTFSGQSNPLLIGAGLSGGGGISSPFTGVVDDARVYNRIINSDEVSALYQWGPSPNIYLPLDEGSGSVISDKSGNNWPITASTSPTWVTGKFGTAIDLNSTNFLYTSYFDYKKAFTQTAWIYLTSLTGADQGVFGQYESYTTNKGMHHTLRNSQPYMGFYGNDLGSAISLVTGRWYHIAYVFDGINRSIYLDGLRIAGPTASVPYNGLVGNTVFGASYNGSSPLRGYLDEVRVYNYARTPEQIIKDMNNL
ncbi:prepilin-type N-terminal cleavage/methylation domain-containing protein [Candidatus Dojkabacteria bacterium]|nr:prepilin-type N-terminal cleavage/methylation domain-containing protein [Candidatus Dojkabacteria bacterium]